VSHPKALLSAVELDVADLEAGLPEGDYSGVLEAGVHYQPVRRDLSDIDAALDRSRDPRHAQAMADRAHDEIVASGRYSWRAVVRDIADQVLT
jgi:hypothetical protein